MATHDTEYEKMLQTIINNMSHNHSFGSHYYDVEWNDFTWRTPERFERLLKHFQDEGFNIVKFLSPHSFQITWDEDFKHEYLNRRVGRIIYVSKVSPKES